MRRLVPILSLLLFASCGGGAPETPLLERWLRVGVDPHAEAEAVARTLEMGGYRVTQRAETEELVALAFVRDDGRRAIRVVTRIGVAVALDSHETDGVRLRHGAVRLVEPGALDADADGRTEIVVARDEGEDTCIAVVRIDEDGRPRAAPIDVEAFAPGRCASALEDVDGDERLEAIVELEWPELALEFHEVPSLRVALPAREGGWPVGPMPLAYEEREREARLAALAEARARLDVAAASRLGVELAALASLSGATLAAQAGRYDAALSGLVLREHERDAADAIRAFIATGWGAPEPAPSPAEGEEPAADSEP